MKPDFDPFVSGLLTITSMYKEDKELTRGMLKKFEIPVTVLSLMYSYLVNRKEINPIESLSEEKKNELWKEAHKFVPKGRMIAYCRASYLLEII